ncbi:hypothetical protein DICPUDRAFT_150900 [Dictyostelium purpureum]|uniref:RNA helicase n=1 Tax=Dictyostelium purpureum TaxID=5786 RepID=F0ZHJ1_DICPU|nr:uncharacterized protein DICPUDRAFT_150900 [Dictyostelium purpureum]EGC36577.1 hypothetical protein DICPUDRAFT_150900 [Dictyostelium purpureum]|eukprot:XP_003286881.1 hypothetical protein DICPUDRAFT_150900 [Dictyostelium purpureum]
MDLDPIHYKGLLQTHFQKARLIYPEFRNETRGPDHQKEFRKSEEECAKKTMEYIKAKSQDSTDNLIGKNSKSYDNFILNSKNVIKNSLTNNNNNNNNNNNDNDNSTIPIKKISNYSVVNVSDTNINQEEPLNVKETIDSFRSSILNENQIKQYNKIDISKLYEGVDNVSKFKNNEKDKKFSIKFDPNISKKTPVIKSNIDNIIPVPLNKQPRPYQIEIFKESMKQDIICCLPTGLGKTLISCMVIKRMKELNPMKRIIFMVDRIPLVQQQSKVIAEETGLQVLAAHGDSFKNTQLSQSFDVLVIIGALLINLIINNEIDLNHFCLIVTDEAHHIVKGHPFAVALKHFPEIERTNRPKLLGLTASPAGKKDFISTLISLKVISRASHCKLIKAPHHLIEPHLNSKNTIVYPIKVNNLERWCLDIVGNIMEEIQLSESALNELLSSADETLVERNKNIIDFLISFSNKLDTYMNFGDFSDTGVSNLKEFLNKEISNIPDARIKGKLRDLLNTIPDDELIAQNHSKLKMALTILNEFYQKNRNNDGSSNFRAIIFVKTRKSAARLVEILNVIKNKGDFSFLKPTIVVGHGSKSNDGMSISKQKDAIDRFRQDKCNLIVATSVVEEGFDVPECNLVIRLDPPTTVTANIQSRGRLRSKDSYFIGIVKECDREEGVYESFRKQEEFLDTAIDLLTTGTIPPNFNFNNYSDILIGSATQAIEEIAQRLSSAGFPMKLSWDIPQIGGSDHNPEFKCSLYINDKYIHSTIAETKKKAKDKSSLALLSSHQIYIIIKDL